MAGFPLKLPKESRAKKRVIVGRGRGSGLGKTCGKGHKGQKSRSGGSVRPGFEGGQMPLYRRLPKRGFSNARFSSTVQLLHLGDLQNFFNEQDKVTLESLKECELLRKSTLKAKILANGEIEFALHIDGVGVSATARKKIEAVGGSVKTSEE